MVSAQTSLDPSYGFTKIQQKKIEDLENTLLKVQEPYAHAKVLFEYFQQIRSILILGNKKTSKDQKVHELTQIYDSNMKDAQARDPNVKLEYCKAFLPSKKLKITETRGKWCRLWHSYAPGLFVYYQFPAPIRTNMKLEQLFSKEKQAIFNRVAKANVCRIVATRGEDYLRILYCSLEEL